MPNTHDDMRMCMSVGLSDPIPISLFFRAYSLNVRVHGRIGLNASLFSRERRRFLASWPSSRAFIPHRAFIYRRFYFRLRGIFRFAVTGRLEMSRAWQLCCSVLFRETQNAREGR